MSLVVATRVADGLRLEIDAGSSLIAGTMSDVQVQHREALFAYLLVATSPEVLKYSTITAKVLQPHGIGLPPSDPMQYIRKLKLSADRRFKAVTGEGGLIASIRGLGYRLAGTWELVFPRARGQIEVAAANLQQAAVDCIAAMNSIPLSQLDDGALVLNYSAHSSTASAIEIKFQECVNEVLAATGRSSYHSMPAPARDVLVDIYSYFSFSRQGQVDERTWRRLFERELLRKVGYLIRWLTD